MLNELRTARLKPGLKPDIENLEALLADVGDVTGNTFQLPANVGPGGAGGACTNAMMSKFYPCITGSMADHFSVGSPFSDAHADSFHDGDISHYIAGECKVCKSQRTNVSIDDAIGWLMQSAHRSPTPLRQFYAERFGDLSKEQIDKAELPELFERLKTNMYQILGQWRGQNGTCVFKCTCPTQNLCLFVDDSIWKPQGGAVEEKWSTRSCTTTSIDLPHFCNGVWRKLQEKKELATKIARAGAFFATDPECDDHISGSGSSHGSGESAAGMPSEQVPESWILLEEYDWTCIQYQSTSMRCPYIHT